MSIFLALCFIILNILDITTTRKIIALGGSELNPIPWLLMKLKIFVPVKMIITLFIALFMVNNQNITNNFILCAIISIFVVSNYYQLYLHKKNQ